MTTEQVDASQVDAQGRDAVAQRCNVEGSA